MLYILTGEIQIGKTRWLEQTTNALAKAGVNVSGVVAPGVWKETADGFEKLGIDNKLLPTNERVSFARRVDLAQSEGTYDSKSQSAAAQLAWSISDDAIKRVNKHFERIAEQKQTKQKLEEGSNTASSLLVVDELGRLELECDAGLTEAMRLLDKGPTEQFPHALIVVRKGLFETASKRFEPIWNTPVTLSPNTAARETLFAACLKTPQRHTIF